MVTPKPTSTYITARIARSREVTRPPHSRTMAARKPRKGTITAATVMRRSRAVMPPPYALLDAASCPHPYDCGWFSLASDTTFDLSSLADEIIEAIRREVPAYARPLEGAFG